MKKLTIILLAAFLFQTSNTQGQITLDTIITPWNGFGYDFYPVQISSTETKYYFQDTLTNTFDLVNMDFTPFMMNIPVPEPFLTPTYLYQVIYISRTLFDCDSSNIEFAYEANNWKPFYVMRTDGTQLLKLDSAIGPYCLGCLGASQDIRPIINTSSGAKLFLHHPPGGQQTYIYSLCGSLPTGMFDFTDKNQSFIRLFPNPTSNSLAFQINPPDNINEYELVIVDNNGSVLHREKLNFRNDKYSVDVSGFSSGAYFYSLTTKDKTYQSGKFVLTK